MIRENPLIFKKKTGSKCFKTLCLLFSKKCTILIEHTCRCDEMVDVADSKSAASDGVPVRVRSPAPKNPDPTGVGIFLLAGRRTRTHLTADVRWTSACRRLDGGNTIMFCAEENANRVRSPAPTKRERLTPLSFRLCRNWRTRTTGESPAASPSAASGRCSEGAACAAVEIS